MLRREELAALEVLKEIDRDAKTSQRQISRRVGVSLGLVNLIIGRLIRKAWIKVTTIPGRRVEYALTAKGVLEKMRKTRDFVRLSMRYAFELKRLIEDRLRQSTRARPSVAAYESGELTPLVEDATRGVGGRYLGTFDGDDSPPAGARVIVAFKAPAERARESWNRAGFQVIDLD